MLERPEAMVQNFERTAEDGTPAEACEHPIIPESPPAV
jgi:hypothetical protein